MFTWLFSASNSKSRINSFKIKFLLFPSCLLSHLFHFIWAVYDPGCCAAIILSIIQLNQFRHHNMRKSLAICYNIKFWNELNQNAAPFCNSKVGNKQKQENSIEFLWAWVNCHFARHLDWCRNAPVQVMFKMAVYPSSQEFKRCFPVSLSVAYLTVAGSAPYYVNNLEYCYSFFYIRYYRVLFGRQQCSLPWDVDEKLFSSVNTTRPQKSMPLSTWRWANASLPALCRSVRSSLVAGVLWWIPEAWSLRRMVIDETSRPRSSRMASALVKGWLRAALTMAWSSAGVIFRGPPGLTTKTTSTECLMQNLEELIYKSLFASSVLDFIILLTILDPVTHHFSQISC